MNQLQEFCAQLSNGLTYVDVGCSGEIDDKWKKIAKVLNLVGFDPNKEECERLNASLNQMRSASFLPYAIGAHSGTADLYCTRNAFCYSLLEPDTEWLRRFSYSDLFEIERVIRVPVRSLSEVPELQNLDIDALKLDTQGLELPILKAAPSFIDSVFYLETETGFCQNYKNETTFDELSTFLRARGFNLFDINPFHRIARNNEMKYNQTGQEQPLWCEAVWLKDYVALARANGDALKNVTREKAKKALVLCAVQGCIDYGFELASLFRERELIRDDELRRLAQFNEWELASNKFRKTINLTLRALPGFIRSALHKEIGITLNQKPLYRMLGK